MEFIYAPRSGDRALIALTGDRIRIVSYSNGCRHVVGGVRLMYETAEPKQHWRHEARVLATEIVYAVGEGVAWDAQGTVSLIVPADRSWKADEIMRGADPATRTCHDPRNLAAMVVAGAARLAVDLVGASPRSASAEVLPPVVLERPTVTQDGVTKHYLSCGDMRWEVPASTAWTVVSGAEAAPEAAPADEAAV